MIAKAAPGVGDTLAWAGKYLFPQVDSQLQGAATAMYIFARDFVKSAQTTLNIVSPLLGLPNPNLVVDGINGPKTQAATHMVQQALKEKGTDIAVDGWYGYQTRDEINKFLAQLTSKAPSTAGK